MRCADCKEEKKVFHNYFNDKTGGFDVLCAKCLKKRMVQNTNARE